MNFKLMSTFDWFLKIKETAFVVFPQKVFQIEWKEWSLKVNLFKNFNFVSEFLLTIGGFILVEVVLFLYLALS